MEVVEWNCQRVAVPSVLRNVGCVVLSGRLDEHRFVGHALSHLYHGDGGRAPGVMAKGAHRVCPHQRPQPEGARWRHLSRLLAEAP